jgi:paraquat-inducible protein A
VQCPHCGLLQFVQESERSHVTACVRCRSRLEHSAGTSLDATLCCVIASLLFFVPASLLPFLTTYAFGASLTSRLPSSVSILWSEGQPLLCIAVCLLLFMFPIVRFTGMIVVLVCVRQGLRPSWLARLFRLCNALQSWAALDVFLLGFVVAYVRLRTSLPTSIGAGAVCFMVAVFLGVIARATLDKPRVWRLIGDERSFRDPHTAVACMSCALLLPASQIGRRCPRCDAKIRWRKPQSVNIAAALLIAAGLLYFPANLFPIATIPIGITPTSYTVLGGVVDLADSHLFGLALLVFTASFTIPLLKMIGLSWCIASTLCQDHKHLIAKTRVYRLVEEVGRWSMVDPLCIACFVPVLQFNGLIDGHAQPAATPFTAVVILTQIAVKAFDPRLLWDRAEPSAATVSEPLSQPQKGTVA